ncbi:MFS transporter, DHA1 family, arabinose polymer transporter [Pseudarcicella hirudinis]|uniref:MFS transporter, DHA1 family, arabinose polymer transporter n=2 Tax=Pseudarcicella hirudinis TaxID=1079859 RepID=A0A1I5ME08_9BACT|nr:MFS transporter, DHA1 family, arabinose polymer transporter [Pseudarcicella hirudinis]
MPVPGINFTDQQSFLPENIKGKTYILRLLIYYLRRMKLSLITLTIGGFGIGMTEFVMMGILPDISHAMNVSIPVTGYLVSSYALGVVLGAPLLVGLAGNYPPKKILIGLMVMFTIFNGLSAFAPNYELLFISRLFAGLPHGAFFGVGAVVASRLADPGREARAVSVMFAGLTIANTIGVPLGTFIGHNFSWRITFVIIALIGLFAIWSIKSWLPELPAAKNKNIRKDLKLFTRLQPWLVIGITAIGTGGFFAWFSYIAPLLTEVSGFGSNAITPILVLTGLGMALGNFIGGRLADSHSPAIATCLLLLAMVGSLITVSLVSQYQIPALAMAFVTGALAFSVASPIQILMINAAKGSEMLASSLSQAGFNIGNAIGAYLGGLPIAAGLGYTSPEWVGAGLAFAGFLIALVIVFRKNENLKTT